MSIDLDDETQQLIEREVQVAAIKMPAHWWAPPFAISWMSKITPARKNNSKR